MNDAQRCVILYRAGPSKPWDLCYIKEKISSAWKSAHSIDDQERILGSKSHKVIVCLEGDFEKGRIKELRPPSGFDFNIDSIVVHSVKEIKPIIQKVEPQSGYVLKKCEYCEAEVKNNGAAQFSHLRKHLLDAVRDGKVAKESADAVRSLSDIRKLLA